MGDFALLWNPADGTMDLCVDATDDDLVADEGLETSVLLSMFTDRRAEDGEPVPGSESDRRGWWADEFLESPGDRMGSRRWLLSRAAMRRGIEEREVAYTEQGLRWMLEDRVASSVDVEATRSGDRLETRVRIQRPGRGELDFRFAHAWES